MHPDEIRELLEIKHEQYNKPDFILNDPIQVPHRFERREDIEIAAFLTTVIAWGTRTSIIRSANRIMELMEWSPLEYLLQGDLNDYVRLRGFVHRTFNSRDLDFFFRSLRRIYLEAGGLEEVAARGYREGGTFGSLANIRKELTVLHPGRSARHIPDVMSGSAAKRLNLFLMWMVRNDHRGVHFGLWSRISQAELRIPLDTHVGRVARMLGLLQRKSNDWKAVEELTAVLRGFDPADPCRYDFSLFGLGLFDHF
ncbi:MAG: TIGR02757 family protein [Bacteroidales bacterium]